MADVAFAKEKIKVLLLEGVDTKSVDVFTNNGYTSVEYVSSALDEGELLEKIKDVHFIGVRSRTQISKKILDSAPRLLAVGCFCIGTNGVDLEYAKEKGVAVFNAPFSNTRSVAEITLGLCIMLMRGIAEKNAKAHRGEWLKSAKNSNEVRGKKLGIVGYGNIGSQVSMLASGMGMHVYYYDIEEKLRYGNATACSSLQELLEISDIVSLHVPETPQTKNLIDAKALHSMKDGSYIINYARGTVINIDDLCSALDSGKILGAALDVFPLEPASNTEEFVSPLREYDQVIMTPHIGGSTQEAQENIGVEVAHKMVKYCENGSTASSVNFPALNLPADFSQHRILHIHKNIPGVLGKINEVFSAHDINIEGQFLQTNDAIGYVVVDIAETENIADILIKLKEIEGTVKARVLY